MLSGVYSGQREELCCVHVVTAMTTGSESVKEQGDAFPKGIGGNRLRVQARGHQLSATPSLTVRHSGFSLRRTDHSHPGTS